MQKLKRLKKIFNLAFSKYELSVSKNRLKKKDNKIVELKEQNEAMVEKMGEYKNKCVDLERTKMEMEAKITLLHNELNKGSDK